MKAVRGHLTSTPRADAATKGKSDSPPVEVDAAPLPWDSQKPLVPGQRHVKVHGSPHNTLRALRDAFKCKLAAEVEEDAWALHITVFVAEAVRLKVEVYGNPSSDVHTEVVFHQLRQDDLAQFSRVCSIAIKHLNTRDLRVSELEGACGFLPVLKDGGLCDDLELEEDWPTMFAFMLKAADSPAASLREEGLQALARWAKCRRDCIPALTDALVAHKELVGRLLQAPLAECYPLTVALRIAFGCPRDAERLACEILPLIPWPEAGLPFLVARELEEAFWSLTTSVLANRKAGKAAKREDKAMKVAAGGFSRATTGETSTSLIYEPSELEEEVTTDLLFQDIGHHKNSRGRFES